VRAIVTIRVIKVSLSEILAQLTAFIGGIVLLIFAFPVLYVTQDLAPWLRLLLIVIAGAVGYLGTIWFTDRVAILKGIGMFGIPPKISAEVSKL